MKVIGTIIACLMVLSFATFLCDDVFAAGGKGNVKQMGKQMYIWHFEEGSGKETKDATAGLVGELVGDIKWVAGKTGNKALEFAGKVGAAQYVKVAHSDELDIDEQITMAAWVYPNSLPTGGQENKFTIMFKLTYYLQIEPGDGTEGHLAYYFYEAQPEQYYLSDATVKAKEWSHVALSWDGTKATYYVNGQKSNTVNHKGPGKVNTEAVQFGGENAACCPRFFQGRLDDVVIANYALSEGEITGLMKVVAVQPQSKLSITWGEIKQP
ncbi:LamG domain-containing protein [Candidatus Poribacteria bacterium]|nr:LamG domain-containing protein [Candidatus Poribacteria bacterium]